MEAARSASGAGAGEPPELVLVFTRFPHPTETFLQREVEALQALGVRLRLVSLWGGGREFGGWPVERFNRWRLWTNLWRVPLETARTGIWFEAFRRARRQRPPSWLSFWENLLGAGYGVVEAPRWRRERPRHVHAVWGSAPAAAAWTLERLTGVPYSLAAHAYDLYEHGGDWLLDEKIAPARFVRTSTAMGAATLQARGVPATKVLLVRRGLAARPPLKPLRTGRTPLRLICVARLVEKKGLERQLALYSAARDAGLDFSVRIYGDGPLRRTLERQIAGTGLGDRVVLLGHRPFAEIQEALAWADGLVHTGVVTASGDRDGLPNVIPEAMAAGVIVTTTPTAATTEAIAHAQTGLVVELADTAGWVAAWRRLATDDAGGERWRAGARAWVEENFDVHRNVAVLLSRIRKET